MQRPRALICGCRKRTKALSKGKPSSVVNSSLPLMALQPPTVVGSVSEAFGDALEHYLATNPDGLLLAAEEGEGGKSGKKNKKGKGRAGVDASERRAHRLLRLD